MAVFLIIDDDDIDRMVVKRSLAAEYPEVTCLQASNVDAALDIVSRRHIDLFVIDILLCHVSGFDCVNDIRKILKQTILPIAMMSGSLRQSDVDMAKTMGLSTLLLKPMSSKENKIFAERIFSVYKTSIMPQLVRTAI